MEREKLSERRERMIAAAAILGFFGLLFQVAFPDAPWTGRAPAVASLVLAFIVFTFFPEWRKKVPRSKTVSPRSLGIVLGETFASPILALLAFLFFDVEITATASNYGSLPIGGIVLADLVFTGIGAGLLYAMLYFLFDVYRRTKGRRLWFLVKK
jgi:hypothetical protein